MHGCKNRHDRNVLMRACAYLSDFHGHDLSVQVEFSFGGLHPCWADTHYMRHHCDTAKLQQLSYEEDRENQQRQRRHQRAKSAESWRLAQVEHGHRLLAAEQQEQKRARQKKAHRQRIAGNERHHLMRSSDGETSAMEVLIIILFARNHNRITDMVHAWVRHLT